MEMETSSGQHPGATASSGEPGLDERERADLLWRIIKRYDDYVRAADKKAAVLATFAVFEIGTALARFDAIVVTDGASDMVRVAGTAAIVTLAVSGLLAFVSLGFVAAAVSPFLRSLHRPEIYRSVIFFGHVAGDKSADDYETRLSRLDFRDVVFDLTAQAHALAMGAHGKYTKLRWATLLVAGAGAVLIIALLLSLPIPDTSFAT